MNVEIFNLSMTYPSGKTALREINLSLSSPNLIGLLGPNGAGKSTLMKLLVAGLLPTEGVISVDGKPLMKQERLLKARLGYLPQSFQLDIGPVQGAQHLDDLGQQGLGLFLPVGLGALQRPRLRQYPLRVIGELRRQLLHVPHSRGQLL